MRTKLLVTGLLASVVAFPVLAQQSPAPSASPPEARQVPGTVSPRAQTTTTTIVPMATASQWRASKLIGVNVYNDQNEKLGDINEILLDQAGKVNGVVIGIGGFLGLGQREIVVPMEKLKFVNEPVRTTSTTTTTPKPATTSAGDRTTTTTTTTRPARAASEKWYPDHAILSGATKDTLKSMTEFRYN